MERNKKLNIVSKSHYPTALQNFALTLMYYSPKAYEYVRSKFFNALPASKTLRKWLKKIDSGPGYSKASLKFLKSRNVDNKYFCLNMDEMALSPKIELLPNGDYTGYQDLGTSSKISILYVIQVCFSKLSLQVMDYKVMWKQKKLGFIYLLHWRSQLKFQLDIF